MKEEVKCSRCSKKATTKLRGNGGLEAILWLIAVIPGLLCLIEPLPVYFVWMGFIVPAIGYTVWRWTTRYTWCTSCNGPVGPYSPTNKSAVASLILGLTVHIPLVTGIAAIILGIVGRKRAKTLDGQGSLLAKVGLILGILSVSGWMLYSFALSAAWTQPTPPPPRPPAPLHAQHGDTYEN